MRWSDALIADAQGIADYYRHEFGAPTELLDLRRADHARRPDDLVATSASPRGGYHLVVARFEPENHVD